jgi:hypothetical protein
MNRYCELVLYVGRCHADGLPPGRFSGEHDNPYSRARLTAALRTIGRYLLPSHKWGLIIDYDHLVKDNAEADALAEFAARAFPHAREIIEPHQCIHGKIIFSRKIRFDACVEQEVATVVETLKASGHIPNEFRRKAEWIRAHHHAEEAIARNLSDLEKRADDFWRSALKFY